MIRLVVLGDPISHSRSPAIHLAALAAAGIEGTYEALRVDLAGLADTLEEIRHGALTGANITMPYKAAAAHLADRCSAMASRSGSVNTWVRSEGEVFGESTDGEGILYALDQAAVDPQLRPLILGAGGAAAAAVLALEDRAPAISARRPDAVHDLVQRLGVDVEVVEWGRAVADCVVINATPLGMKGEQLPAGVLESSAGLLDMTYGAAPTPSVMTASSLGLPVADGITMLVGQAAASFELWTGVEPNRAVMRAAALKPLKQVSDTAENAE